MSNNGWYTHGCGQWVHDKLAPCSVCRNRRESMSRKKAKPLTAKQLADMDFKHETKKATAIKARGIASPVTAAVTDKQALLEAAAFGKQIGEFVGHMRGVQAGRSMPRTVGEQRALDQGPFVARILQEVFLETKSALRKHGSQHSPHEGIAVLQEEVDELWDEIKADRGRQLSARKEAIQVAAMAVRYVLDNDPR